jgi:beta-glucanase (GH16 family)
MTADRADRPTRRRALLTSALAVTGLVALPLVASGNAPAQADPTTTSSTTYLCGQLHICPPTTTTLPPVPTTTVAPDCGGVAAVTSNDGDAWACTFSDDFNGTTLDPAKWIPSATTDPAGKAAGTTLQTGTSHGDACIVNSLNNEHVDAGYLYLTARTEPAPVTCKASGQTISEPRTTGEVSTYRRLEQTFGRIEIVAKLPNMRTMAGDPSPGLQTSFWMWTEETNKYPESNEEIDIAEMYSHLQDNDIIPVIHYNHAAQLANPVTNQDFPVEDFTAQFHTYTLEWTPTHIQMYFDGTPILQTPDHLGHEIQDNLLFGRHAPQPFDHDFYLILSQGLGLGGDAYRDGTANHTPQTPLPASTVVDHVYIWGPPGG